MSLFRDKILDAIGTRRWTSHGAVLARFSSKQATAAVLGQMIKCGELWCSYEATMHNGWPVLTPRYCRPHDVGDPLIGRRIVQPFSISTRGASDVGTDEGRAGVCGDRRGDVDRRDGGERDVAVSGEMSDADPA